MTNFCDQWIIASFISPQHLWTLGLVVSIVTVAVVIAVAALAPIALYRRFRLGVLLASAAVLVLYAMFNFGGLFALGAGASGVEYLFLVLPVLTPLIMLLCLVSVSWSACAMWLAFAALHSFYWSLSKWNPHEVLGILRFEWPVYSTALILTVLAWRDRKASPRNSVPFPKPNPSRTET
jgi:hypothetical protein